MQGGEKGRKKESQIEERNPLWKFMVKMEMDPLFSVLFSSGLVVWCVNSEFLVKMDT